MAVFGIVQTSSESRIRFRCPPEVKSLMREIEILVPVDPSRRVGFINIYFYISMTYRFREIGQKPKITHAEKRALCPYAWSEPSCVWYQIKWLDELYHLVHLNRK